MANCNWDPSKHEGRPCPIHGSSAKEGKEDRKNRREELKQNENDFYLGKQKFLADYEKNKKSINDKYNRKSSEKYNIGSDKKLSGEEREKMQDLVDAFNEIGVEAKLVDGYEDAGADMKWTAPSANNTWLLTPREWIDYMNGTDSLQDVIENYADKNNIDIDEDALDAFDDDYDFENWNDEEEENPNSADEIDYDVIEHILGATGKYGRLVKKGDTSATFSTLESNFKKINEIAKKYGYKTKETDDGSGYITIIKDSKENKKE